MNFKPSPAGLPVYSTLDWKSIITSSNPEITVTSVIYDQTTGQVSVDFDYSATIEGNQVQLQLNTADIPVLSEISPFNVSIKASSDDNQALYYYSSEDYAMSNAVKYLSTALGVLAILFLLLGAFGGRLIGL